GDLGVVIDDQFEELIGQARFDGGAVAQQLGVAGAIASAVQEGPLEEVDQDASGLIDQRAARRGRGVLGGEVVVGIGAKVSAAHGSTPYRARGGRSGRTAHDDKNLVRENSRSK